MRILTRYVLAEMLKVFLVSLAGVTLLFLLGGVVKEGAQEGLGLKQIILIIPYVLPEALRFSVPAAMLFAACNVFGRLSSANEIIAIKASGISPMVLLWPAVVLAFFVSLWAVWLNDVAVSWGYDGLTRVVIESVEDVAYGRLKQQHSYSSKQFSILVSDVDGKRLIHPTITLQGNGNSPTSTITCEQATMRTDLTAQTLTLFCDNCTLEIGDVVGDFPHLERVIPLDEASHRGGGNKSPSYLPMNVIPQEKIDQQSRIETLQQQLAAKAAYELICGDFPALEKSNWAADQAELTEAQQRMHRLDTEPPRRWANGFSCLCFVLVGVPLAIWLRNSDLLTSFFLCFLPILLCYYPLLMFAVSKAKSGTFPAWGVWAGNMILAIVGLQFMRSVTYDSVPGWLRLAVRGARRLVTG
jgi:lipopolysaccharide export system permease protein